MQVGWFTAVLKKWSFLCVVVQYLQTYNTTSNILSILKVNFLTNVLPFYIAIDSVLLVIFLVSVSYIYVTVQKALCCWCILQKLRLLKSWD